MKRELDKKNIKYSVVELDLVNHGKELEDKLKEMSHCSTVPNTYIGGKHFGGCRETMEALDSGSLFKMVECSREELIDIQL